MSEHDDMQARFSLKRWSTRKLQSVRDAAPLSATSSPAPADASPTEPMREAAAPAPTSAASEPTLPPVDSLTIDSDFSVFMGPKVAEPLKRQALKKLFADPHFNVMDGLDIYIDDYSLPSPIEPELVAKLLHAQFTLNPPVTRVNAAGVVEDVPPEELAVDADTRRASDDMLARDAQGAHGALGEEGHEADGSADSQRLSAPITDGSQ